MAIKKDVDEITMINFDFFSFPTAKCLMIRPGQCVCVALSDVANERRSSLKSSKPRSNTEGISESSRRSFTGKICAYLLLSMYSIPPDHRCHKSVIKVSFGRVREVS